MRRPRSAFAVPTPSGTVTATVPGWSNTGPPAGDGYVRHKIMLPKKPDRQLERFIAQWQPAEQSPRRSMGV